MTGEGAVLGLPQGTVTVRAYSTEWPRLFAAEKALLTARLGELALDIQHIGSTSVPGLSAKPVLDIGVAVASFEAAYACLPRLAALGYIYRGENGIPRRQFDVKGQPHSLDWDECTHSATRCARIPDQLGTLAQRFPQDSDAYMEA